jgi:hypothetical protein
LENRNRAKAGPSTWTSVAPDVFRSEKSRTTSAMKQIQKAHVVINRRSMLPIWRSSGRHHGFSIQSSRTPAMTPRVATH